MVINSHWWFIFFPWEKTHSWREKVPTGPEFHNLLSQGLDYYINYLMGTLHLTLLVLNVVWDHSLDSYPIIIHSCHPPPFSSSSSFLNYRIGTTMNLCSCMLSCAMALPWPRSVHNNVQQMFSSGGALTRKDLSSLIFFICGPFGPYLFPLGKLVSPSSLLIHHCWNE